MSTMDPPPHHQEQEPPSAINLEHYIYFDPSTIRRPEPQDEAKRLQAELAAADPELRLSADELDWAIDLKVTLQQRRERHNEAIPQLTDFELVQHALVAQEDTDTAVERICRLEDFRRQYSIDDTVEQGVESLRALMQQQPGFSLAVDRTAAGQLVHALDFAKFHPERIVHPPDTSDEERQWSIFMRGMYYLQNSLYPSVAAIRTGVLGMVECEGLGWHNFDEHFEQRLSYELAHAYPMTFSDIHWCHSGVIANVIFNLLRPFLPQDVRGKIRRGVQLSGSFDGRMDALFLQPTPDMANERQVERVQWLLQQRERNIKLFVLANHY